MLGDKSWHSGSQLPYQQPRHRCCRLPVTYQRTFPKRLPGRSLQIILHDTRQERLGAGIWFLPRPVPSRFPPPSATQNHMRPCRTHGPRILPPVLIGQPDSRNAFPEPDKDPILVS